MSNQLQQLDNILLRLLNPWRRKHYNPSQHWAPLNQQHNVTSQGTWILR